MFLRLSESGGVCDVQNVASVVPELQPASGGADPVLPPVLQAVTIRNERIRARIPRPGSNVMAFSFVTKTCTPRLLPVGRDRPGRERADAGPPITPSAILQSGAPMSTVASA